MVYYYHKLFSDSELSTVCKECKEGTRGCVMCKKQLINNIVEYLKPIREKRKYYEDHMDEVENILKEGTDKARKKVIDTMQEVKHAIGIDYY